MAISFHGYISRNLRPGTFFVFSIKPDPFDLLNYISHNTIVNKTKVDTLNQNPQTKGLNLMLKNNTLPILFLITSFICTFSIGSNANNDTLNSLPPIISLILEEQPENISPPTDCPDINQGNTIVTSLSPNDNPDISSFIGIGELTVLSTATRVEGDLLLQIGPEDGDINSNAQLSLLNSLVEVTGDIIFQISPNENFTSVENVFPCLKTIGGFLILNEPEITQEPLITDFDGFVSLETIDGGLSLIGNNSIERITGFQNLTNPNGNGFIIDNINFDCQNDAPSIFSTIGSFGNEVDCN